MLPTLVAILILSLLLLAIPVDLAFALKKEEVWRGRVYVVWMFGLARMSKRVGRVRKKGRRRSLRKTGRALFGHRRRLWAMLRSEGFIRRVVQLMSQLIRLTKPRRFRLQCVIGLEDPADTGRLAALLAPLKVFAGTMTLGRKSNVAIQVSPDFSGPRFSGQCCSSVHFVPLKMMSAFVVFLFSAPVRRAARAALAKPQ